MRYRRVGPDAAPPRPARVRGAREQRDLGPERVDDAPDAQRGLGNKKRGYPETAVVGRGIDVVELPETTLNATTGLPVNITLTRLAKGAWSCHVAGAWESPVHEFG
jgi:hypothetical protein